ncbi:MAG: hypothetical protein WBL20_08285 [Sphingobium sp.]
MRDSGIIDWLSTHSESFRFQHNAHRESATTVARHLLHRERLGEQVMFGAAALRQRCIDSDTLWELSVRMADGTEAHVGGPSFDQCLQTARATFLPSMPSALAA